MTTNQQTQVDNLERRILAIEERINQLQRMIGNLANTRELNGIRIVLEDTIKTLNTTAQANKADISNIKTRLRLD